MLNTTLLPFVLPCDFQVFTALQSDLHTAIQPQGALEQFAFERLVNTAWNLRRVSNAEMSLLASSGMEDPLTQPEASASATRFTTLTRQLESSYRLTYKELIDLQTARALRNLDAQLPPLADPLKVGRFVKQNQTNTLRNLDIQWKTGEIEAQRWFEQARAAEQTAAPVAQPQAMQHSAGQSRLDPDPEAAIETIVRPTPKIGRNEACPCGSGQKYKRCCGNPIHQPQPDALTSVVAA